MINWIKEKLNKFKKAIIVFVIGSGVMAAGLTALPEPAKTFEQSLMPLTIIEKLENKNAKEKAEIKAEEISKLQINEYIKDIFEVEIIGDIKQIEINGQHGIEILARAWKNSKQLGFGKDGSVDIERFRIYNPPILIADENGDIIIEWEDEDIDTKEKTIKQRRLREDMEEATKQVLIQIIELVGKENTVIIKDKVGNTTSTFYPDADPESTSVDGNMLKAAGDWASARVASGATLFQDDVGYNNNYFQLRTTHIGVIFLLYDTSALPDRDTISSAVLSQKMVYIAGGDSNSDQDITLVSSTPASDTALVLDDYDQRGSTRFATDLSITSSDTTAKFFDFTLNASGINNVIRNDISKFAIRFAKDFDNSDPGAELIRIACYFAESAGTTDDPKLVVVHEKARKIIFID